ESQPLATIACLLAAEPGCRREPKSESQRTKQMGRQDDLIQPMANEYALDLQQPQQDVNTHQRDRCPCRSSKSSRAASRSTSSRRISTPRMNSSASVRLGTSRPSSWRYSERFCVKVSPA